MIAFSYTDNSQAVSQALESFQDALADNAPALASVADDFREMLAQQFASEGRAGGTPWPARVGAVPEPPSRRMAMQASPLLVRTGALRDSLTTPGAAGRVEELDGGALTLGTRLPYAMFHQLGTRRMPARPLIVLSDERASKWTEIVRNAIQDRSTLLGAQELGGKL